MSKYNDRGFANGFIRNPHNIGDAVRLLKQGYRVARAGWSGKGMYLILRDGDPNSDRLPQVDLINAHGKRVAWNASQEDLLALDYDVVEEAK